MSYGAKKYKNTAVKTASKEKILLMLYEAAIKYIKLAKKATEENRISDKCNYITKTHDIISELSATLDHSQGPEVAEQLESLYSFCVNHLIKANMDNNVEALDSVQKVMTTLHEGWVAAVDEIKNNEEGSTRENN